MRISVILATYNSPEWLEKVLCGYAFQSVRPHEFVIADDGSKSETFAAINRMRRDFKLPIEHVWHPDDGFRKCEILNKAITAASGDYLIFSDGDCIPRRDFVEAHARFAAAKRFLSGGLVRLPRALSQQIETNDISSQRAWSPAWLAKSGLQFDKKYIMIAAPRRLSAVMDRLTTTRATWNGHNASGWKHDLVQVNGFDERMGYGGEDRELGERLVNAGVRPMQIRHRAICLHLDHDRGYVDEQVIRSNQALRAHIRRERITWTEYGIVKRAADDGNASTLKADFNRSTASRRAA